MDSVTKEQFDDYTYKKKCNSCLIITSLIFEGLYSIVLCVAIIANVTSEEYSHGLMHFISLVIECISITLLTKMLLAIKAHETEKHKVLMKAMVVLLVVAYIFLIIASFVDDEGKPLE